MADTGAEMSKSAKRRAAKKARDAAAAEEEAAPAPAPAPAPKAKAKAAAVAETAGGYPTPKAKAKAKAEAAPAPAPEPTAKAKAKAKAEPKAEPKAQPKAKAKAEPAPAPEPKAEPKATAKAKAKTKPAPKEEPVVEPKKVEIVQPFEIDDGKSGDWEVSTGLTKKQQKRQDRKEEETKMAEQLKKQGVGSAGNKHIPGFTPIIGEQRIPGMPNQSVQANAKAAMAEVRAAGAKARESEEGKDAGPKVEQSSAQIKVPEKAVGIVIGPKGAKIKLIQEKTGTRIDTSGELFTVTGPAQGVGMAEAAIRDLITKGYTALAYDDFEENYVMVFKESLPDIIGKKGAVIIELKDKLGVEINIPKEQGNAKKCKIGIAGPKDKVEKAKEVINNILMYGHDEITHPGDTHMEIEIPDWAYGAVIGPKGSELRHIQKNYEVRVNIPRETSLNQMVVIVGSQRNVERANTHIERVVANFTNQVKGRGREDKAEDGWGDEGPEEEWMKAYLYKR